ncbi:MAG TPA: A/G-specific adenine glycosylase [Candidatus Limnocylindria bacterium]
MAALTDAASIRGPVLAWYALERRDFPWRGTADPYAVLVSEVMLQQTQASRVAERYPRFLRRFANAEALAAAPPAAVLAEWSGLGYNRRALALQGAASIVASDGWPRDVAGLQRLPGVGPYTARAIASLAFGTPIGVVDTNVRRWLLRRFGGPDDASALQSLADALAAPGRGDAVAAWTHASMELGASVCRSRAPRCDACPIAVGCPSRGIDRRIAVPRQPGLRGSARAYRGALLRALAEAPGHRLGDRRARTLLERAGDRIGPPLDDGAWERVLAGLERDGLIHRSRGGLELGAATIAS